MPSPEALRAAANGLEHEAARLPTILDRAQRAAGPHVWCGPAADGFGSELRIQRDQLRRTADDLRHAAARLRARADTLEEQLEREAAAAAEAARRRRAVHPAAA